MGAGTNCGWYALPLIIITIIIGIIPGGRGLTAAGMADP